MLFRTTTTTTAKPLKHIAFVLNPAQAELCFQHFSRKCTDLELAEQYNLYVQNVCKTVHRSLI